MDSSAHRKTRFQPETEHGGSSTSAKKRVTDKDILDGKEDRECIKPVARTLSGRSVERRGAIGPSPFDLARVMLEALEADSDDHIHASPSTTSVPPIEDGVGIELLLCRKRPRATTPCPFDSQGDLLPTSTNADYLNSDKPICRRVSQR